MSTSPAENPVPGVVTFTARSNAALDQLADALAAECDLTGPARALSRRAHNDVEAGMPPRRPRATSSGSPPPTSSPSASCQSPARRGNPCGRPATPARPPRWPRCINVSTRRQPLTWTLRCAARPCPSRPPTNRGRPAGHAGDPHSTCQMRTGENAAASIDRGLVGVSDAVRGRITAPGRISGNACGVLSFPDSRIAVMQTTRKAVRPHKGERHPFLVKLSPEMVDNIHLLAQINERTYVEVVEVVATDAPLHGPAMNSWIGSRTSWATRASDARSSSSCRSLRPRRSSTSHRPQPAPIRTCSSSSWAMAWRSTTWSRCSISSPRRREARRSRLRFRAGPEKPEGRPLERSPFDRRV
jgi:hypothetical protein